MGWLDAHESFVMEIIARDRVDELYSTVEVATASTERTVAPPAVVAEARHRVRAGMAVCPRALAKASR